MAYKSKWKPEAEKEFDSLDFSIQKLAFFQFKKLGNSPELGKSLGNKAGLDLTGYRKIYFFGKKYRIVYKIEEDKDVVTIFSIGKKEGLEAYRQVIKRLESM